MSEPASVRLMVAADVVEAGRAVAEAFEEDPMFALIFPRSETGTAVERRRRLATFFRLTFRYAIRHQLALTLEPPVGGAMFFTPEHPRFRFGSMVSSGLVAMPLRIGRAAFSRYRALARELERLRWDVTAGRGHVYLMAGSVKPSERARGLGRALMEARLEQAERRSVCAYLETVLPDNVGYFERFGFRTVAKTRVAPPGLGGSLPVWCMVRRSVER